MSKPKWVKITGLVFVVLLVLNMVFLGIRLYGELVFWIILAVVGIFSWVLVKKTKG